MFCSSSQSLKAIRSRCWGLFLLHIRVPVFLAWKCHSHTRFLEKEKHAIDLRFTPTPVVLLKFIRLEFSNKPRHQFSISAEEVSCCCEACGVCLFCRTAVLLYSSLISSLDWRISTRFCHTVIALFTRHVSSYPAVLHMWSACVVSGVIFFIPSCFLFFFQCSVWCKCSSLGWIYLP